jgi:nitrogen regulatory protein PII
MPVLLVAVIDDPARLWDVLDAWERLGIIGATIFDSTGLHRTQGLRDDLPLFPSVRDLLAQTEAHHRTLWSVLADDVDVEAVVRVTEEIVGPLTAPRTGIVFTLPVLRVWGLRRPSGDE